MNSRIAPLRNRNYEKQPTEKSRTKKYNLQLKKNSLDGFNGRMEITEDRVNECKERPIEVIQSEK